MSVGYDYDSDSQITDITYNFGATNLGNLTYSYDQLGRIIQTGGSFARTSLPGSVASAAYDAANELTNWNGTTISYDANGNMLSDGTNTFTWNARNQVATLNGISLQYDAFGRRTENASGKSFLYDDANVIREFSGSTLTASIWAGGLDEIFQRSDGSGVSVPLADALGSPLALVDSSGNIQTTYSYDPFGYTIAAGVRSSNPSQYTGRENDGNGLYYLRARYYSPVLGRFISPDPMGFGAGINVYRYVGDDPVNASDPFGLQSQRSYYDLPFGWRALVDPFNFGGGVPGGQANFEMHIMNPSGKEVGTVSGANGWIGKHGEPGLRPPGVPEEVMNAINGINVYEMRQRFMLPRKGRLDIKGALREPGGGYLNPGRVWSDPLD